MLDDKMMTEYLPVVRITPSLKQRLEVVIAGAGATTRVSDHIRFAVEQYVSAEEAKRQQQPTPQS